MKDILKSKLIGEKLSSVEFIHDYLQLHFDGRSIIAYIWPEVVYEEKQFCFGEENYRDKLCGLIGLVVKDLYFQDKEILVIIFNEPNRNIRINLDPSNPDIVSEIAIFNDSNGIILGQYLTK